MLNYETLKDNTEKASQEKTIEEISSNLDKKFIVSKISGYIKYLNTLNLSELPEELLSIQAERLELIIDLKENEKFQLPKSKIIDCLFWLGMILFSFRNIAVCIINNETLIAYILSLLGVILNGYLLGKRSSSILKEYKSFKKSRNAIIEDAKKSLNKINSILDLKYKLSSINYLEQSVNRGVELVNQIGEQDIASRIAEIESDILLLPKEEEKEYQDRLSKALAKYKEDLPMPEVGGIALQLNSKLVCLNNLNQTLNTIESELKNRTLFINEEEFYKQLALDTTKFIESTSSEDFNASELMSLNQKLAELINNADLMKQIAIEESFAKCFWASIDYLSKEELDNVLTWLRPVFHNRIILEGERILDNLDQTIDVMGSRSMLLNYKNSENYNFKKYIQELIYYLKLYKNKNKARIREI